MKTNGPDFSPYAALIAVQALFGSLPAIGKLVLAEIPSVALVGFRVGLTAVILTLFQVYRNQVWLDRRSDYLRLGLLSLFGVVINQLLFVGGLSLTKAANTSLLAVSIPIFTLIVGLIVGSITFRWAPILGVALAAFGIIILIDPVNASFEGASLIGDSMIVLNSLAFAIYVATSKEVVTRNGAMRSMMWVFVFAGMICVPIGAVSLSRAMIESVGLPIWVLILYISIGATALPYLLNAWALARVSPATLAIFIYLQPIIGFVLAAAFLGEELDLRFAIATTFVFLGVFLVTNPRTAPRRAAVDT